MHQEYLLLSFDAQYLKYRELYYTIEDWPQMLHILSMV